MLQKIFTITICFFLCLDFAFAQTDIQNPKTEIFSSEGLRIDLVEGIQDPETKIIIFEMILQSDIDSDRVLINWNLSGNARFQDPAERRKNISIRKNERYTIPISIVPVGVGENGVGISEVVGEAEAFFVNSSIVSSVRKRFFSNIDSEVVIVKNTQDGLVLEPPDEYTGLKNTIIFRNVFYAILIASLSILVIVSGIFIFLKYLNKEDRY